METIMRIRRIKSALIILLAALWSASCLPRRANVEPTVDVIGTTAAQLASVILTQTAGAPTPTPPPPTNTTPPSFTDTPAYSPTPAVTSIPKISGNAACYEGPGSQYALVSNLQDTEEVIVIGIGSVPGWYVIENPYYGSMCWVETKYLTFDPTFDPSILPTMPPP